MEFILGSISGFVIGFGLLYIQYHKSEISYSIATIKEDLANLHVKIEQLLQSFKKE